MTEREARLEREAERLSRRAVELYQLSESYRKMWLRVKYELAQIKKEQRHAKV